MAKKATPTKAFTPDQKAKIKQLGLNPANLDWGQIIKWIKIFTELLERFNPSEQQKDD